MIQQSMTIEGVLDKGLLQQIQDSFVGAFQVPAMVIDSGGTPVTSPSHGKVPCGRFHDDGSVPEDCRERIRQLLRKCADSRGTASSACPHTGLITTARPICIGDVMLGAWLLDSIHLDEAEECGRQDGRPRHFDGRGSASDCVSFTRDDFERILGFLQTLNNTVIQLGGKCLDVVVRDREICGINARMDVTTTMLRKFIDSSHVAMYICDYATGDMLMVNEAFCKVVGQSEEAILGRKCWRINGISENAHCSFCPRNKLLDDKNKPARSYTWDYFNPRFGRWFRCTHQAVD